MKKKIPKYQIQNSKCLDFPNLRDPKARWLADGKFMGLLTQCPVYLTAGGNSYIEAGDLVFTPRILFCWRASSEGQAGEHLAKDGERENFQLPTSLLKRLFELPKLLG